MPPSRSARRGRRARGHGRREPAAIQPRRDLPALRLARQGQTLLREASRPPASRSAQEDSTIQILHLATAGAFVGPYAETDAVRTLEAVREAQADPRAGRNARRLSARSRPAADGAWRCAAAASASIRTPPSRPAISSSANAMPRSSELSDSARRGRQHGRDPGPQMAGEDLRRIRHRLSAHREGQSIVLGQEIGMDGRNMSTGCRAGSRSRTNTMHAGESLSEGHILNHIVNGRIHGEIRPHLSDEGGTTLVPLQLLESAAAANAEARSGDRAADPRACSCRKKASSGPRPTPASRNSAGGCITACSTACRARKRRPRPIATIQTPTFTTLVGEMTGLGRDTAKTANFAKGYGAGVATFAKTIGKSTGGSAGHHGAIRRQAAVRSEALPPSSRRRLAAPASPELYDGALRHWNLWEAPRTWPRAPARAIRRGKAPRHRPRASLVRPALSVAPGRARHSTRWFRAWRARHTKLWMRAVFQQTGIIPLLQMHDALECSVRLARAGRDWSRGSATRPSRSTCR